MKRIAKFAMFVAGLMLLTSAAIGADDPVKERQALMKEVVGKNAKLGNQLAKGEVPYNAAVAETAMKAINGVPDKYTKLFPEGTDLNAVPDSEASPKIWSDMAGFIAAADKLKAASAAAGEAAGQGEAQFAAAFGNVIKACKGCHDAYRVEKD